MCYFINLREAPHFFRSISTNTLIVIEELISKRLWAGPCAEKWENGKKVHICVGLLSASAESKHKQESPGPFLFMKVALEGGALQNLAS